MTIRPSGWLTRRVRATKPAYLVLLFGLVAGPLAYWLDTEHTKANQILLVSLVLLVVALLAEVIRELGATHDQIVGLVPYELCWDEADILHALRGLDKRAQNQCQVRSVWGALSFSDQFRRFMIDQLAHVLAGQYTLERWIDMDIVDERSLIKHVRSALPAIEERKYTIHLVRNVRFGAMVVDENAAAVNFAAHHSKPDIIGVGAQSQKLAQRVRSLIDDLGPGVELPDPETRQVTLASLEKRVRDSYISDRSVGTAAGRPSRLRRAWQWLRGAST